MKFLLATVAAVLFFHASLVMAGSCREIEYAELKDTSSSNLVKTYCRYAKLVDLERDYLEKQRGLYLESPNSLKNEIQKTVTEHSTDLKVCLDTQMKIRSALKNRGESDELTCSE